MKNPIKQQEQVLGMNEEPTFKTHNRRDTEQLIKDIEMQILRIKLARINIALYLLSSEVPSLWEGTSDS